MDKLQKDYVNLKKPGTKDYICVILFIFDILRNAKRTPEGQKVGKQLPGQGMRGVTVTKEHKGTFGSIKNIRYHDCDRSYVIVYIC